MVRETLLNHHMNPWRDVIGLFELKIKGVKRCDKRHISIISNAATFRFRQELTGRHTVNAGG